MKDNTKVLVGIVAGFAAGVALGVLFAPGKGSETRDKLSDSLKNLGDAIRERAAEEIDNLNSFKDRVAGNMRTRMRPEEQEEFNGATDQV